MVNKTNSYANWLTVQEENKKQENTPQNAMSYADYLSYTGGTKAADQYRQEAGSTYADYLAGSTAYRQNAVKTANSTVKRLAVRQKNAVQNAVPSGVQGAASYADYLAGSTATGKSAAQNVVPKANSYADYLAGSTATGKSAASRAVQNAVQSEANTTSGYARWLTEKEENKPQENIPHGAMSYADYLSYTGGTKAADQYRQEVKSAYADYLTGKVTYGQNAEKLAQSGLTGSGYGDYLAGVNYTARQNAVSAARGNAEERLNANARSYAEYLSGVKEQNAQNEQIAYNNILSQGLSGERAKQYALGLGLSEEQANSVIGRTDTLMRQSLTDNAYNQIAAAVSGGSSFDGALAALKGTYSEDILTAATEKYMGVNKANIDGYIGSMTSAGGDALNAIKNDTTLTQEEKNKMILAAQAKNKELIDKALREDFSGLAEYAKTKGMEVNADTVRDLVTNMCNEELISRNQMQDFFYHSILNEIANPDGSDDKGLKNNTKNTFSVTQNAYQLLREDRINEEQYKNLLRATNQALTRFAGGVEVTKVNSAQDMGDDYTFSIFYNQGGNRNEGIKIDPLKCKTVSGKNFISGQSIVYSIGNDQYIFTFGTINGRPAYYDSRNKKYYSSDIGTPGYFDSYDNAGFIAYMCTAVTETETRTALRGSR